MVGSLVSLLVLLIVVGVCVGILIAIIQRLPIQPPFGNYAIAVVLLIALLVILSRSGLLHGL
jgi:hypothetical protein